MRVLALILTICFSGSISYAHKVVLKNGETIEAQALKLKDETIVVRATVGGGVGEIPYPRKLVEKVIFEPTKEELILLTSGDRSKLGDLKALWNERKPFLTIGDSDAGNVGLTYARLLLAGESKGAAKEALGVIEEVRQTDWSERRRLEASRMRIAALAATGNIELAMQEADQMEALGASDDIQLAEARVRSKFVKANLAWSQLKNLEKDWPKWHLMPEKRAERTRFLNEALDQYLFPVVAHTELESLCAEGLVKAARIYQHLGLNQEARRCVDEVLNYFPNPTYAGQAREIQRTLNQKGKTS